MKKKMVNGKHQQFQIQNLKENGHKKKIPNPKYKGEWQRPTISNPNFKEHTDLHSQSKLKFVGFDLWQVKAGTVFSHILVSDSVEEAAEERKEIATLQKKKKKKMKLDKKKEEEEAKKKQAEQSKKDDEEKIKKRRRRKKKILIKEQKKLKKNLKNLIKKMNYK